MNGKEILKAKDVDDADLFKVLWNFHYGICDHLNNPKPLVVYYDDISIGSTSFEDGWGWNPEIWKTEARNQKPE